MTEREYLDRERRLETRNEYFAGRMRLLPSGNERHNLHLPSIDCHVEVGAIYEKVDFT